MRSLRHHLRPTRIRLTLAFSGVFLVVATVAAVGFWLAFQHIEYGALDASLDSQSLALTSGLDTSGGHVTLNGNDSLPGQNSQGIAINAVLLDSSGTVLDRSGPASTPTVPTGLVTDAIASGAQRLDMNVGGQPVRLLAQRVGLGNGRQGVIVLTRPIGELRSTLQQTALLLATVVAALTSATAYLGYRMASRALRPVRMIASTAEDISAHDLHRRIDLDLPPDELGQLAATFNGMLSRLDDAFSTLQRFTADAAHELRAPLALVRTEVEVSLSRVRTPEEYQESQRTVLAEVERLSRLADHLLVLARADAGALTPAWASIDLPDLVEETVERWQPLAHREAVSLSVVFENEGTADADADLLRRVFDNLLDNAIRHTPSGGSVTVTGSTSLSDWKIAVSDSGGGVPASLKESLFERFTRSDAARGRDGEGAGLGLSLCRAIVQSHGGSLELTDGPETGATFLVTLPSVQHASGV